MTCSSRFLIMRSWAPPAVVTALVLSTTSALAAAAEPPASAEPVHLEAAAPSAPTESVGVGEATPAPSTHAVVVDAPTPAPSTEPARVAVDAAASPPPPESAGLDQAAPPLAAAPGVRVADPLAAARMVGTEAAGAGLYFLSYGLTLTSMTALYGPEGNNPAPGIALGLAIGGAINAGVGAITLVAGRRRLKATDAWLDARPGRRDRFIGKAQRRGLFLHPGLADDETKSIVRNGQRRSLAGIAVVMTGGLLNGVGVSVAPLSPGAGLGLNVAGWSAVVVGAVIAARGKKMAFRPENYRAKPSTMAMAPTVITTPDGRRMAGVSLVGRW